MGDKKLTLLELHFDGDTQFGPAGNLGSEFAEEEAGDDGEGDAPDVEIETGGGGAAKGLLGLVALLVALVVVKKLLGGGGGDDGDEEFDD